MSNAINNTRRATAMETELRGTISKKLADRKVAFRLVPHLRQADVVVTAFTDMTTGVEHALDWFNFLPASPLSVNDRSLRIQMALYAYLGESGILSESQRISEFRLVRTATTAFGRAE